MDDLLRLWWELDWNTQETIGPDPKVSDAVIQAIRNNTPELLESPKKVFEDVDDLMLYLEAWESDARYSLDTLVTYINSDTIWRIHPSFLIRIIETKNTENIEKIWKSINEENLKNLDDSFYNVLRALMRSAPESIDHIVSCITSDNLMYIYWYTIKLFSSPPSALKDVEGNNNGEFTEILIKLRNLIDTENRSDIDKRVRNFLKDRWEIITFFRSLIS